MALTFPLAASVLADTLGISSVKWRLQDNREFSGLGSGQIVEVDLAPSLWAGEVELYERYHADMRAIEAKINAIIRSSGTFYLYDPRLPYPSTDPDGTLLAPYTNVQIASLPDAKSMSLKNCRPNFTIPAGSYLSFDYGSSPTRRAFHEFAEDATTNGSGVSSVFEVSPFIRPGAAVNQVVTLLKPAMRARIVPNSFQPQSAGALTSTASFSVIQKL